jgi:glutathione peroxidase-family protein
LVVFLAYKAVAAATTIFDFTVTNSSGKEIDMKSFKGKEAYIIVNVASN